MNKISPQLTPNQQNLLKKVGPQTDLSEFAHYLRVDGTGRSLQSSEGVSLKAKPQNLGLEIRVRNIHARSLVYLPVIIAQTAVQESVSYDYFIEAGAQVTIYSGCIIHNNSRKNAIHNALHQFIIKDGARVIYIEDHYGESFSHSPCIINPKVSIHLGSGAQLDIKTTQFAGISRSNRQLCCRLAAASLLKIDEKLITEAKQSVSSRYYIELLGADSRAELSSRSVAADYSRQRFYSRIRATQPSFAHSACDAIIKDHARVESVPAILAEHADSQLVHEAAIGRIASDQIFKLMTLGLSQAEAEQKIISNFLR